MSTLARNNLKLDEPAVLSTGPTIWTAMFSRQLAYFDFLSRELRCRNYTFLAIRNCTFCQQTQLRKARFTLIKKLNYKIKNAKDICATCLVIIAHETSATNWYTSLCRSFCVRQASCTGLHRQVFSQQQSCFFKTIHKCTHPLLPISVELKNLISFLQLLSKRKEIETTDSLLHWCPKGWLFLWHSPIYVCKISSMSVTCNKIRCWRNTNKTNVIIEEEY